MPISFFNRNKGIDTSDATAVATDIANGKTAYAKGEKLEGTAESITDYIYSENKSGTSYSYIKQIKKVGIVDMNGAKNANSAFRDYSNLEEIKSIINTNSITNTTEMFYNCNSLKSVPEFDTYLVSNFQGMFFGCKSLKSVPKFDTSNATNLYAMFQGCTAIIDVPKFDTHLNRDMTYMFSGCENLVNIPELDTSNVKSLSGTFTNCYSITNIPQLDTSKVTNMDRAFLNCEKLVTVPLLDTSKITSVAGFVETFKNCSLLSNDSLNIILQMLINATAYTGTKTLKYIGLSETQAQTCTTLSNWAACQEAGWTTGY